MHFVDMGGMEGRRAVCSQLFAHKFLKFSTAITLLSKHILCHSLTIISYEGQACTVFGRVQGMVEANAHCCDSMSCFSLPPVIQNWNLNVKQT
jgi:hypothetical protein